MDISPPLQVSCTDQHIALVRTSGIDDTASEGRFFQATGYERGAGNPSDQGDFCVGARMGRADLRCIDCGTKLNPLSYKKPEAGFMAISATHLSEVVTATKHISRAIIRSFVAGIIHIAIAAPALAAADDTGIDYYTLPYFTWMDPDYENPGEIRYFDLEKLMHKFSISRLAAVEIQNRYRDMMIAVYREHHCDKKKIKATEQPYQLDCLPPGKRETVLREAIHQSNALGSESKWSDAKLQSSPFIVVFDLDETLFSDKNADRRLLFSPHWLDAFKKVKTHGGAIVLFTAKPDEDATRILDNWNITEGEKSVNIRDYVDAIFTNHYLVELVDYFEHRSIIKPAKDLRIIDPTLEKIIIIDDNPNRIWQTRNLRYIRKWNPIAGDESSNYAQLAHKKFHEERLLRAVDEIIDSHAWAAEHHTKLVEAFLPYSHIGKPVTIEIATSLFGGNWNKAIEYVRTHPAVVDREY